MRDDQSSSLPAVPPLQNSMSRATSLQTETVPEASLYAGVSGMVSAQAATTPQAAAVVAAGAVLTYEELEARSNQLANYLKSAGVNRGSVVALYLQRSANFVLAALAVMKAGAAYLPVDPESPAGRIAFMLEDSGVTAVVTAAELRDRLPAGAWQVVDLERESTLIGGQATNAPDVEIQPEDLAYVIYTSGSTGQPKGVEIPHSSLLNLISWHRRAFHVTAEDRASFLAALGFDAAVWELWPYLSTGATVLMPEDGIRNDARALRNWLLEEKITISFAVTAMAESLLALDWPTHTRLRYLLTGADVLRRRPAANLPFALVNNYGPTEYTVVATSGVVEPGAGVPTIGRAIDGTTAYVLDEGMREVPQGETGELFLGGDGLARGYRNRPELTAERFVQNPFSTGKKDRRLYRTGDLVRVLATGELEFLGRVDEQVKIRGFRIEPNEIVSALDSCAGVRASAVIVREEFGEKRLVGYVVPVEDAALSAPMLRDQMAKVLPDYMVPTSFVAVEKIPATANGKVDRAALPAPTSANLLREECYVAPRTMVEERLADLIAPLLRVDRVGVNDNFFLLGGHSLLGTQLITRIGESFGVNLPLLSLFDHPTLAGMASEVEQLILEKIAAGGAQQ